MVGRDRRRARPRSTAKRDLFHRRQRRRRPASTTLGAGLGAELAAPGRSISTTSSVIDAFGTVGDFDGDDSFGLGVGYDLGGGAQVLGGIARTYARETVADFGLALEF